jgi:hypothetical protein
VKRGEINKKELPMTVDHEEVKHRSGSNPSLKLKKEKHLKYQVLFWRGRRDAPALRSPTLRHSRCGLRGGKQSTGLFPFRRSPS